MNIQNHKQKKKNKQVVNQIHGIKSLGCNARPSRMCAKTCVEYDSGWLAVTCEAIIETRSAQGLDCNNATHTNSLIILNPTHLSSLSHPVPFFFFTSSCVPDSLLVCPLYSFCTNDQFLTCFSCKVVTNRTLHQKSVKNPKPARYSHKGAHAH